MHASRDYGRKTETYEVYYNKLSSAGIGSEKLSSKIQFWHRLVLLREAQLSNFILTQISFAQKTLESCLVPTSG